MYSNSQLHYLKAMGIPAWEPRSDVTRQSPESAASTQVAASSDSITDWLSVQILQELGGRSEPRFTLGLAGSELLVLADCLAPTAPKQPFYGPAGNMLDGMLNGIKLNRKSCQLAALSDTSMVDGVTLESWVKKHNPKVILFLSSPQGAAGYASFLPSELPDSVPLETEFVIGNARCLVSYHPDYLMSNIALKPLAWEHWKQTLRLLGQIGAG